LQHSPQSRPLDALAITVTITLCLIWGFNQVAIKLSIHDFPPLIQAAGRSAVAALCVAVYTQLRGIPLFKRDGTLLAGIAAGLLFTVEFVLVYRGLVWTTATRTVLFLYTAPFFVAIGSRLFIPGDPFYPSQWIGLLISFAGIVIAFGLPTPAADPRQMLGDLMVLGGALAWGATTIVIKASPLSRVSAEKTALYQLVVSAPLLGLGAMILGEHMDAVPSALSIAAFLYQAVWVVSVSFVIWFALILRYSANRLSAFTFLTPLFGVAAGYLVLREPLTPAFALAVAFVALGLMLVNRPR
jgi:drug/metabolite transporter (DMT)-like permease